MFSIGLFFLIYRCTFSQSFSCQVSFMDFTTIYYHIRNIWNSTSFLQSSTSSTSIYKSIKTLCHTLYAFYSYTYCQPWWCLTIPMNWRRYSRHSTSLACVFFSRCGILEPSFALFSVHIVLFVSYSSLDFVNGLFSLFFIVVSNWRKTHHSASHRLNSPHITFKSLHCKYMYEAINCFFLPFDDLECVSRQWGKDLNYIWFFMTLVDGRHCRLSTKMVNWNMGGWWWVPEVWTAGKDCEIDELSL